MNEQMCGFGLTLTILLPHEPEAGTVGSHFPWGKKRGAVSEMNVTLKCSC